MWKSCLACKAIVSLPRFWWGSISKESIAANEEDDIRPAQGGDIFQPEKLHIELIKEVGVDEHGHAEEKVADVGNENQQFSSGPITPRSKEESKDDAGNLVEIWFKTL